jgi:hypothetical protein
MLVLTVLLSKNPDSKDFFFWNITVRQWVIRARISGKDNIQIFRGKNKILETPAPKEDSTALPRSVGILLPTGENSYPEGRHSSLQRYRKLKNLCPGISFKKESLQILYK